ncbi:MAG: MbnP family protein [Chitinophagaceae bacterium]
MKNIIAAVLVMAAFASCKKDNEPAYNNSLKAELSVEFDNVAGSADLQLNTATYTNGAGESLKITKVKYYVSNFLLTTTGGTVYQVPQDSCYFLIDESDASTHEPSLKVPEGEYATLSFMVGVDSLRNTMDISKRTGVLDPTGVASDMYWGWNSGYIFAKFEGTSPAITASGNVFQYHIGGFGGYSSSTPNNLKTITLDLTARGVAKVKTGKDTNIHLFVDVLKAFTGATNMSFATTAMIHSAAPGVVVANNYASMFRHDHTEN